jgi:hypothetical protein
LLAVVVMVGCSAWGQATMAERVCWIDNDPQTLTTIGSSVATVDVTSLAAGPHTLTMQVKDSEGRWSVPVTKIFVKPHATQKATAIAERQYWIDNEPAGRDALGESVATVDISALPIGMHSLTMRVRDDGGMWSVPVTKFFVVNRAKVKATEIVVRKFWIDNDAATRTDLDPSVAMVDISSLSVGMHSLTMHVQDNAGVWSLPVTKFFIKPADAGTELGIVRYLYWFDDDVEHAQVVEPAGPQGIVDVDVSALAAGEHTIYWRVGDSRGVFSQEVGSSLFRYTVPASGYGTFSAADNMAMGDGLKAYFATYLKETNKGLAIKVDGSDSRVVPAETGVVLAGEAGQTYTMVPTTEDGTASDDNKLVAVVESRHVNATDGEFTNFMLQGGKFIKILDENGTVKMPAHRAYLPLPTEDTANAHAVTLIWGEDTATGLDGVRENRNGDGTVYNLQGQKVENPSRGIYIINGKKVVVK